MELHEMKNVWASVDARLKENEMLNKRIVQEMLHKKSNKSHNKLINTEFLNIIECLVAIPLSIWLINYRFENFLFPKILFITVIVISIFEIIRVSYILKKYLLKIDFSKSVKDNMHYINKFTIYHRKRKMTYYLVMTPVISLLGILSFYELKVVSFHSWTILLVGLAVATVVAYWTYQKIYDANIQSIKKSLEELEELKEID